MSMGEDRKVLEELRNIRFAIYVVGFALAAIFSWALS